MPTDRFYFNGPLIKGSSISMEDSEHHHLSRVMRITAGEEVELVNGQGSLAKSLVSNIGKHATLLNILEVETLLRPSRQIILAIALMRPSKLELILEKGTELGADGFLLYPADFSEKTELSANQMERLRNLTISALKQSGRLFLPELEILSSLQKIPRVDGSLLFGDTREKAPSIIDVYREGLKNRRLGREGSSDFLAGARDIAKGKDRSEDEKQDANPTKHPTDFSVTSGIGLQKTTTFVTGPERGFSPAEIELLEKKAQGVRLSPNILRAETAPLAAVSILMVC